MTHTPYDVELPPAALLTSTEAYELERCPSPNIFFEGHGPAFVLGIYARRELQHARSFMGFRR